MDIQRKAFQEWYIANHHDGDIHPNQQLLEWSEKGGFYFASSVEDLWEAWQAAKAQAVPEGFVLVQKELPESIAEELALKRVSKPFGETDPVWVEITEKVYKEHLLSKKWELCRDYKAMIEAQEQSDV